MVQSNDNLPKHFVKVGKEGNISIEQRGLSYRLRWTTNGKTTTLPIGKGSDAYNVALARAKEINSDLMLGRFDESLVKYNPAKARQLAVIESESKLLTTHWENYKQYSKGTVQKTTQAEKWKQLDRCLAKVDPNCLSLDNPEKLVEALLSIYSATTVNRCFNDILAAINLAVKQGKITKNPYTIYKEKLVKLSDTQSEGGEFKRTREVFTQNDLEAIFSAFSSNCYCSPKSAYQHSYYLPYVKFLAFTGCRPEEAIALTKADILIKDNRFYVSINKAFSRGELKCTKNEENRIIPVNQELMEVLRLADNLCPESELLFPSIAKKSYIEQGNFQTRYFRQILIGLFLEDKISKILPTYNLRHTRISQLLKDGVNPSTVAQLMGTSTTMIYRHYCGNLTTDLTLPPMMK